MAATRETRIRWQRALRLLLLLAAAGMVAWGAGLPSAVARESAAVVTTASGVGSSAVQPAAAELPAGHPVTENPSIIADVVERTGPAVVFIRVEYDTSGRRQRGFAFPGDPFPFPSDWFWPFPDPGPQGGSGSGFIIDEEGLVLTNQHLFSQPDLIRKITVTLPDREEEYEATLVGSDFDLDLAVLRIKSDDRFPTVPLGDSDAMRVGEWVIAIGNPYQFEHTVTVGVLSATGREIAIRDTEARRVRTYRNLLQTDAAINPGNSGGPLLNLRGEVIGINTAVSTRGQGIGFAIPINEAKKVLEDLINRGRVIRPFIGIRYMAVDRAVVEQLGLPVDRGILIVDVLPGTAAERAGLRVYDVVTRVGRHEIGGTEDFLEAIRDMKVGDTLLLTVIREGREVVVRVEVGERPEQL